MQRRNEILLASIPPNHRFLCGNGLNGAASGKVTCHLKLLVETDETMVPDIFAHFRFVREGSPILAGRVVAGRAACSRGPAARPRPPLYTYCVYIYTSKTTNHRYGDACTISRGPVALPCGLLVAAVCLLPLSA